jgi:peptide-methionine (S)-S-oxide reductase
MRNVIMFEKKQSKVLKSISNLRSFVVAGSLLGLLVAIAMGDTTAAEQPRLVPPATYDVETTNQTQTAVLAGGCFWGIQGVFQHVTGVHNATSGYAGGLAETATYEMTETGATGHAEAVQIKFDPQKISYGRLLQIYFSAAHDPTQFNRQGPDSGTQYRSAIFPTSEEQAKVAAAYIAQLGEAKVFGGKIVTSIETGKRFYEAEDYHQDFMVNNPTHPYIVFNEQVKIENLKAFFPQFYLEAPVLVHSTRG